jgi:hypothetical protein
MFVKIFYRLAIEAFVVHDRVDPVAVAVTFSDGKALSVIAETVGLGPREQPTVLRQQFHGVVSSGRLGDDLARHDRGGQPIRAERRAPSWDDFVRKHLAAVQPAQGRPDGRRQRTSVRLQVALVPVAQRCFAGISPEDVRLGPRGHPVPVSAAHSTGSGR